MTEHSSNLIQGRMEHVPLPSTVLEAFGVNPSTSIATVLAGGAGTTYLIEPANIVLKPTSDVIETEVICNIQTQLVSNNTTSNFSTPKPLRTSSGSFIFQGWCAFNYVPNVRSLRPGPAEYTLERFKDILRASAALHVTLRDTTLSEAEVHHLKYGCNNFWANAHQAVWSEETDPQVLLSTFAPGFAADKEHWYTKLVQRLLRLADMLGHAPAQNMQLYKLESQLIHGDLVAGGNMLFPMQVTNDVPHLADPPSTPVIIDLSPTFGPHEYATGILLADSLIWCGADLELIELAGGATPQRFDMIRRGLLFRCLSDIGLVAQGRDAAKPDIVAIERVTSLLEIWVRTTNTPAPT